MVGQNTRIQTNNKKRIHSISIAIEYSLLTKPKDKLVDKQLLQYK